MNLYKYNCNGSEDFVIAESYSKAEELIREIVNYEIRSISLIKYDIPIQKT